MRLSLFKLLAIGAAAVVIVVFMTITSGQSDGMLVSVDHSPVVIALMIAILVISAPILYWDWKKFKKTKVKIYNRE